MSEQRQIWTDGLGNTLWKYGGEYLITTVMTRTSLKELDVKKLMLALVEEFGYVEQ